MPLIERFVLSEVSHVRIEVDWTTTLDFTFGFGMHYSALLDPPAMDWSPQTFTLVASATDDVMFAVYNLNVEGLVCVQGAGFIPAPVVPVRERLIWGKIPPNATNLLADGEVNILRIQKGGEEGSREIG